MADDKANTVLTTVQKSKACAQVRDAQVLDIRNEVKSLPNQEQQKAFFEKIAATIALDGKQLMFPRQNTHGEALYPENNLTIIGNKIYSNCLSR